MAAVRGGAVAARRHHGGRQGLGTQDARVHAFRRLEHLHRGTSVIIFPEGSRSRDGEVHNFKEGAFLLAREAGVPILPCVIDGAKTFIKGWRVRCNTFTVRITPPVPAGKVAETPVREVLAEVRERTVSELAAIRGREKKTEKER